MEETLKKEVIDLIKSEEMRAYFEELISRQTEEIRKSSKSASEYRETNQLKEELMQEKSRNSALEYQIKELKISNTHYIQLFEEKKKENDIEREKVKRFESQLNSIEREKETKEIEYRENERIYKEQIQKVEEEKLVLEEKNRAYENKYSAIESASLAYQNLSENMKSRISNVFKDGNMYAMIVAAGDWGNITGIWNYVKRRIIEEEEKIDVDNLKKIFRFVFDAYSAINPNCKYKLISPEVGEKFDSDLQSIKGTKTDGRIEEVLLEGIFDENSRKVIEKALVKVQ